MTAADGGPPGCETRPPGSRASTSTTRTASPPPGASGSGRRATRSSTGSAPSPPGCCGRLGPGLAAHRRRRWSSVASASVPGAVPAGPAPREDSLCTATARTGLPFVVPDARQDERVRDLPPVAGGAVGSYLGVPLTDRHGYVVGVFCVYDAASREWSDDQVSLLQELATAASAELERVAAESERDLARLQLGLALDSGGIGSWDWDLAERRMSAQRPAPGDVRPAERARARAHPGAHVHRAGAPRGPPARRRIGRVGPGLRGGVRRGVPRAAPRRSAAVARPRGAVRCSAPTGTPYAWWARPTTPPTTTRPPSTRRPRAR